MSEGLPNEYGQGQTCLLQFTDLSGIRITLF